MRNKTIIVSIIFFAFAFFVPVANAITQTASDSSRPKLKMKLQEKRAEFKEKLEQLKDTRKKQIAKRADEKLAKVNQNSTERMNSAIEKLETLLEKFATRAAAQKTEGKDTAEVDAAIVAAKDAIADAKEAVVTQAAKVYTADLSDEGTLKNTFGQAMSDLRKDLKATHDVVKLAKEKVMDVARALAKLRAPSPTI